jgi:uncharacterized integral membrane protein
MVPWKLIVFFIFLLIFVLFAAFNIKNVSDISLGFRTFEDIPIFISLFVAFLLGGFVVLPFAVIGRRRKQKKQKSSEPPAPKKGGQSEKSGPSGKDRKPFHEENSSREGISFDDTSSDNIKDDTT